MRFLETHKIILENEGTCTSALLKLLVGIGSKQCLGVPRGSFEVIGKGRQHINISPTAEVRESTCKGYAPIHGMRRTGRVVRLLCHRVQGHLGKMHKITL